MKNSASHLKVSAYHALVHTTTQIIRHIPHTDTHTDIHCKTHGSLSSRCNTTPVKVKRVSSIATRHLVDTYTHDCVCVPKCVHEHPSTTNKKFRQEYTILYMCTHAVKEGSTYGITHAITHMYMYTRTYAHVRMQDCPLLSTYLPVVLRVHVS